MALSKSKMESNKKYDQTHSKYQTVKMRISEYEAMKKAVEISGETTNGFMRKAIMDRVKEFIPDIESGDSDQKDRK